MTRIKVRSLVNDVDKRKMKGGRLMELLLVELLLVSNLGFNSSYACYLLMFIIILQSRYFLHVTEQIEVLSYFFKYNQRQDFIGGKIKFIVELTLFLVSFLL